MHRDALYPGRLLGAVLPVDLEGLDGGKGGEAVVAEELAEDGVEAVEVRRLVEQHEELRAVGAGPLVGHGHDAAPAVLERRAHLVGEGAAPDGPPALGVRGRVRVRRGAGLHHEARDEAVEGRLVVVAGGAECEEVLGDV